MNKNLPKFIVLMSSLSILLIAGCNSKSVEEKNAESDEQRNQRHLENKTPTLNLEPEPLDNIIKQGTFSKSSPTTVSSEDNKYRVTLWSNTAPIPMQKIHTWTAYIEKANGQPLEKATIYIHGGMPQHRHGFPVQPRVEKYLGDGNYLIKGIKFSMIGEWEMRLNIKEPTVRDRAIFKINISE